MEFCFAHNSVYVTCYFEYDKGKAYNGTVNTAVGGKACKNWKNYKSIYTKYYPDHNYCRNPRTDAFDEPWCYIDEGYITAVCSITACVCKSGRFGNKCEQICHCKEPDCNDLTGHCSSAGCEEEWSGHSCNGTVCISSRFGEKCEQFCHCKEPGCDDVTGRCNKIECEEGWAGDSCNECSPNRFGQNCERVCHCQHGECDNITGVCYKPGCMKGWTGDSCNYTTDCVLKTHDTTYNGTVNITKSNSRCKRWENTDKGAIYRALEENYCRNPSFDTLDYPWCYTESGNPRFDTCAIPLCVCQPGFYGENCQSKCHCAVGGCNTISGECNNPTAGCKVPWTGRKCSTRFSCPDLHTSSTSKLLTPTSLTGYHINDTVKFLCDVGYALSGPDILICIINDRHNGGKWNNSQPVCQYIECSKSSLHLTDIEVINTTVEKFNFGDVINISCKHGYIGEAKLLKCVNMNKWTANRPVCRVVPCPDFNMTESIELPTKLTKYHLHDIAIFKCRSGYILSGNATLTCLAYNSHPVGKWSSVQPICIDNTSSAFPAAAVGAGVGSATAIILVAVIIVFLVKRRRALKHRTQKSTIYKETPLESNISEEAEIKGDLKKFSRENDRDIIVSVNNDNTYYNKVEVEGHYNNEEDGEGYYSFTLDKQIPRSAVLMKEFYDYVENGREVGGKLELEFAVSIS
ncbi:unnamed protein product [Mytilus coruscus]|uniref:Uncharacterized protein n=1 Tax=Mytilus coruscus TaxID=42192 RepID=A0A6J8AI11_MYTCO|nr:unnamed protein product [Mytilus coruscus]